MEESNASKHCISDKDKNLYLLSQENKLRETTCFAFSQCFNLSVVIRQPLEQPIMHYTGDIIACLITTPQNVGYRPISKTYK